MERVPITLLPEANLETVMVPVAIPKVLVEYLVTRKTNSVNRVNLHAVSTIKLQEAEALRSPRLHIPQVWTWTQRWNASSTTHVTHKVQTVLESSQFLEFSADL